MTPDPAVLALARILGEALAQRILAEEAEKAPTPEDGHE
jgi:hypothetical protein